jgi:hypothetical protein
MGIFHDFAPAATDEDNPDIVRPLKDWPDDHLSPAHLVMFWEEVEVSNGDGWTDQPAALTRMFNDDRTRIIADLRYATSARIVGEILTGGASGAEIRAQYSLDGVAWNYLDGVDGPALSIASVGLFASQWYPIAVAARVESVWLRFAGINGNAVADPHFRSMFLFIR